MRVHHHRHSMWFAEACRRLSDETNEFARPEFTWPNSVFNRRLRLYTLRALPQQGKLMQQLLLIALLIFAPTGQVFAGDAPPADTKGNVKDYAKSCDRGEARGCYYAGLAYSRGEGVGVVDRALAADFFLRACDGGQFGACTSAGWHLDNGVGVPIDKKRAADLFLKACDGGEAKGCFYAGLAFFSGEGVSTDHTRATQLFMKACDGQYAEGCFGAGGQFDDGLGVSKDPLRASEFYQRACDGGSMRGCNNLASELAHRGDHARATELFVKACDGGCAPSCRAACERLDRGIGTASDKSRAGEFNVKWHELARTGSSAQNTCRPYLNRQIASRETSTTNFLSADVKVEDVMLAIAIGAIGLVVLTDLNCGKSCSQGMTSSSEPFVPRCDHFECTGMRGEICYPASYASGMNCRP